MRILASLSTLLKSGINSLLQKFYDPQQELENAYQQQVEILRSVRQCREEVETSLRRLESRAAQLGEAAGECRRQARHLLSQGREKLAAVLLQQKQEIIIQLNKLEECMADLEKNRGELLSIENKLVTLIESFRAQRELMPIRSFTATEQHALNRLLANTRAGVKELSLAVERIQHKSAVTQQGAALLSKLQPRNLLTKTGEDELEQELQRVIITNKAREELNSLKKEMAQSL